MTEPIAQLIQALVPPARVEDDLVSTLDELPEWLPDSYRTFLAASNGGYTQDRYWHFFGLCGGPQHNLIAWNQPDVWKTAYGIEIDMIAFAEDLFGNQYVFARPDPKHIRVLSVVDGIVAPMLFRLTHFAEHLLREYESPEDAGWQLARRWMRERGEIPEPGDHLSYNVPPILGGAQNDLDNLNLVDANGNMSISGQIAVQVRGLPPGSRVSIRIEAEPTPNPPALLDRKPWWRFW